MKSNDINKLMSAVALKDQSAFKQLYENCSSKIYGLLVKIIYDKELAADTLQEVFTKIWLNAEKCDVSSGHAWPWVCQLARNTALDKLRQMHRYPVSTEEIQLQETHADISSQWHNNIDLNHCLTKLTAKPRQAIILSYLHGFSHTQLSQKLSLPLGTLKSTIRRSMKELALCLSL